MKLTDMPEFKFVRDQASAAREEIRVLEKKVVANFSARDEKISSLSSDILNLKKSIDTLLENQEKILYSLNKLQALYKEIYDERVGIADRIKNASHLMDKQ